MFGLPKSTEEKKIIPKETFFGRVGTFSAMTTTQKTAFNEDVTQVAITNVVGPQRMPVAAGRKGLLCGSGYDEAKTVQPEECGNPASPHWTKEHPSRFELWRCGPFCAEV